MSAATERLPIEFRVVEASSEESDCPATALCVGGALGRGWQSARQCAYPQWIVFELVHPTKVSSLQLLSHQCKISRRVDVLVAFGERESELCFKKIGHFLLSDNENSRFQSRELKTVFLHSPAQFLKLVFHSPHANALNLFGQVGVVSLSLFAAPRADASPSHSALDADTARQVEALERAKREAVAHEDYAAAKALKEQVARLQAVGEQLARLERQKEGAIAREDYDAAMAIKEEIARVKERNAPARSEPALICVSPATPPIGNRTPLRLQVEIVRGGRPMRGSLNMNARSIHFDERPLPALAPGPKAVEEFPPAREESSARPPAKLKQMKGFNGSFEEAFLARIASAKWAERLATLVELGDALPAIARGRQYAFLLVGDRGNALRLIAQLLARCLTDNIAAVASQAMNGLERLVALVDRGDARAVGEALSPIATALLEKCADYKNEGAMRQIVSLLRALVERECVAEEQLVEAMLARKAKGSFKHAAGRLVVLRELIEGGVWRAQQSAIETLGHATEQLESSNKAVREEAHRLIVAVYAVFGEKTTLSALEKAQIRRNHFEALRADFAAINENVLPPKTERRSLDEFAQRERETLAEPVCALSMVSSCNFCKLVSRDFSTDDGFDLHLWRDCPMLAGCARCGQVVEVAELTSHLLTQCAHAAAVGQCPRCRQAIDARELAAHCRAALCPRSVDPSALRCPLCLEDLPLEGDEAENVWFAHLVKVKCKKNPRTV